MNTAVNNCSKHFGTRESANVAIAATAFAVDGNTLTALVTFEFAWSKFGDFARGFCLFALVNAAKRWQLEILAAWASTLASSVEPRRLSFHPEGKSESRRTPARASS